MDVQIEGPCRRGTALSWLLWILFPPGICWEVDQRMATELLWSKAGLDYQEAGRLEQRLSRADGEYLGQRQKSKPNTSCPNSSF
jgi:hypothetical protein